MAGDPIPSKRQPEPKLALWWSKYHHTTGKVTEHISPYRLKVIAPLYHNLPHKIMHHVKTCTPMVLMFGSVYAITTYANKLNDQMHRSHWD